MNGRRGPIGYFGGRTLGEFNGWRGVGLKVRWTSFTNVNAEVLFGTRAWFIQAWLVKP